MKYDVTALLGGLSLIVTIIAAYWTHNELQEILQFLRHLQ